MKRYIVHHNDLFYHKCGDYAVVVGGVVVQVESCDSPLHGDNHEFLTLGQRVEITRANEAGESGHGGWRPLSR